MALRAQRIAWRCRPAIVTFKPDFVPSAAAFENHSSRLWVATSGTWPKELGNSEAYAPLVGCRTDEGETHRLPKVARVYRPWGVKSSKEVQTFRGFPAFYVRRRTGCGRGKFPGRTGAGTALHTICNAGGHCKHYSKIAPSRPTEEQKWRADETKAAPAQTPALRPGSTARNIAPPQKNTSPRYREAGDAIIRAGVSAGLPES
jgi:hypothetical protein